MLLSREGDEKAFITLNKMINRMSSALIEKSIADIPYKFSKFDRDYVFQAAVTKAVAEYCFAIKCSFIYYLERQLYYGFSSLAKTKADFAASINLVSSQEPSLLLRDCSQKDDNDLMGTLFTWKNDIVALAAGSCNFTERDIRIINKRLDNEPFADIAEKEGCSTSTCKKVWKKFISFAKRLLNIHDE